MLLFLDPLFRSLASMLVSDHTSVAAHARVLELAPTIIKVELIHLLMLSDNANNFFNDLCFLLFYALLH